ncbi:hypothetical protein MN0502_10390 [Arthrobacter sp. MN05-02]|nr:hypothetical protein MN0502_10390 [Arthrobacter sp. MN05-02]
MVLGGREDVDDAAAHCELTAVRDHVHPGVRGVGECLHDVGEGHLVADLQRHGLQVAQARDERLEDGPDRCGDDLDGRVLRMGEPAQDGQAASDGVGARRQPLVGQRLPGGELLDGALGEVAAQGGREVLRLPPRGRDGEDHRHRCIAGGPWPRRSEALDHLGDQWRAHAGGRSDLQVRAALLDRPGGIGPYARVGRILGERRAQSVQAHGVPGLLRHGFHRPLPRFDGGGDSTKARKDESFPG